MLTWCDEPIPEPNNVDADLRLPTEMNAAMNPKYGFVETFDRIPFTGTTEKLRLCRPDGRSVNHSRREKRRKRADSRHSRPTMPVEPRVLGSPNSDFLKWYGLNNKSHLMDWFTAFMPLTPNANKEDPAVVNVKGDPHPKFAVSNWTAYSNTEAMLNGAGEEGHIFAGKHRPFTNRDIASLCLVFTSSTGLHRHLSSFRRCSHSQSSQLTERTGLPPPWVQGINRSIVPFDTSLHARIHW